MKKFLATALLALVIVAPSTFAVPDLQLFVSGGRWNSAEETWMTSTGTFDLFIMGQTGINDVLVSMAITGVNQSTDVSGSSVLVDGAPYPTWAWGTPPLATLSTTKGDLPKHAIFPTYFSEFMAGDFHDVGGLGDAQPDNHGAYWDPSTGYTSGNQRGEIKKYHITVNGNYGIHFDAYNLTRDNRGKIVVDKFAPFSHDAEYGTPVPEPGSLFLLGLGLVGLGIYTKSRM